MVEVILGLTCDEEGVMDTILEGKVFGDATNNFNGSAVASAIERNYNIELHFKVNIISLSIK